MTFNIFNHHRKTITYIIIYSLQGAMFGLLASFGVMFWIVTGAQMAMVNNELLFVGKNVTVAGCPTNVTLKNQTDYSGSVKKKNLYLYSIIFEKSFTQGVKTRVYH